MSARTGRHRGSCSGEAATVAVPRWDLGELPAGTARCIAVTAVAPAELTLEFFDGRMAVVALAVEADHEAPDTGVQPLAVRLARQEDDAVHAHVVATSALGPCTRRIPLSTALDLIREGVHATLSCQAHALEEGVEPAAP